MQMMFVGGLKLPDNDNGRFNMGDMMLNWMAGYYRNARHIAITFIGDKHRSSVPCFLNGNLKLNVESLDGSA